MSDVIVAMEGFGALGCLNSFGFGKRVDKSLGPCMLCIWHYFTVFNDGVIFYCIYMPILFIHSSVGGHLACFHVLAIVNSTAVNIEMCVSFLTMFFFWIYAQKWDYWSSI